MVANTSVIVISTLGGPVAMKVAVVVSLLMIFVVLAGPFATVACAEREKGSSNGLLWWNKSFKKASSSEKSMRVNIQASNYALQISPSTAEVCRLGFLEDSPDGEMDRLPETSCKLWVEVDDKQHKFKSSRLSGPMGKKDAEFMDNSWRVIESGSLCQRFDMTNVKYEALDGRLRGRVEIRSLPEFFHIVDEVTPLVAIPGRVKVGLSVVLPAGWNEVQWTDGNTTAVVSDARGRGATFAVSTNTSGKVSLSIHGNTLTALLEEVNLETREPWYDARYGLCLTVMPSRTTSKADVDYMRALQAARVSARPQSFGGVNSDDAALYRAVFDEASGCHELTLPNTAVNISQWSSDDEMNAMERYRIRLDNPSDMSIKVPVVFAKPRGGIPYVTGYVAMLRDAVTGEPTGIPVQLSKNWHSRADVPMLFDGTWARNTVIVEVPPKSSIDYELTLVIHKWGGVPSASIAQLCLIGWGTNGLWIESALGSHGETICYEPEGTQMPDASMIDDVRPFQVTGMAGGRYNWTTNQGGGNFIVLYDEKNRQLIQSGVKSQFVRYGPNLTELRMTYTVGSDAVKADVKCYMARTDDAARFIYKLRYDVVKDIAYKRLAFFQMGSDSYAAGEAAKLAMGTDEGLVDAFGVSPVKNAYVKGRTNMSLAGRNAWVCLYDESRAKPNEKGAAANRGLVVREWKAVIDGKQVEHPSFSVHNTTGWPTKAPTPQWELSAPTAGGVLKAGDYIEATVEMVLIPQYIEDYHGSSSYLPVMLSGAENSWEAIYRYARGNDLTIDVSRGSLVNRYPVKIAVDIEQNAEFSINEGIGYVPVTFENLTDNKGYVLEELRSGEWMPVNQSFHGNDFWQTDRDAASGLYSYTYNIVRTDDEPLPITTYRFRKRL